MELKVKKVHPEAKLPTYANPHDAGMDWYALERVTLKPGEVGKVRSGVSIEIPEGYVGLFWDKSSVSTKGKIKSVGGVIDAGYRGEVLMGVMNLGQEEYIFEKGDKVLQMLIQPVNIVEIEEAEELSETARGQGGFGSTGK